VEGERAEEKGGATGVATEEETLVVAVLSGVARAVGATVVHGRLRAAAEEMVARGYDDRQAEVEEGRAEEKRASAAAKAAKGGVKVGWGA
jgi:hypothetical protein